MPDDTLIELAAEIVGAYVAHNSMPPSDLPGFLSSIHGALAGLGKVASPVSAPDLVPAVSIRKSVREDYIVSLEDGRKFKSLRRHLAGLGMTPEQYRTKWGLPYDYPMVAPSYAKARSELAKSMGFGTKRRAG